MTTSRDDTKGAADHGDGPDAEAEFDELARRAGAALRRPAPEHGAAEIARRSRRAQLIKTGAVTAVVVLLIAGAIVVLSGDGEPDRLVPAETTVDSSAPSPTVGPVETSSPPATSTAPTTDPVTSPTGAPADASSAATSVTVPWTGAGEDDTTIQLLDQTVTPSSIGDLRWTVVESTSGDEVGWLYPVRGPRGFMLVRGGELMISDDAVSWRAVAAPFPGTVVGIMQDRADSFVLTIRTPDGSSEYWQSSDLETWNLSHDQSDIVAFSGQIDGPGLVTESGSGPLIGSIPVLPNGATLTQVSVALDLRGRIATRVGGDTYRAALEDSPAEVWWEPSDSLSGIAGVAVLEDNHSWGPWADAKAQSPAAVEIELSISGTPDDWVVEVADPATGETLGTVRGSIGAGDLANTLTALVYGQIHDWFVIDGDTAELVHPDWADGAEPGTISFATTPDGLFVYVGAGLSAVGPPQIWRTTDGRTWEQLGAAIGWPEPPAAWVQGAAIYGAPDGGLIAVFSGGRGELEFLTSDDGVNWQPATQPPALRPVGGGSGYDSSINATERGFVLLALPWSEDGQFVEVWTSADGDVWSPVDADDVIIGNAGGRELMGAGGGGSSPNLVMMNRSGITWLIDVT
jgi:hypothetical protein